MILQSPRLHSHFTTTMSPHDKFNARIARIRREGRKQFLAWGSALMDWALLRLDFGYQYTTVVILALCRLHVHVVTLEYPAACLFYWLKLAQAHTCEPCLTCRPSAHRWGLVICWFESCVLCDRSVLHPAIHSYSWLLRNACQTGRSLHVNHVHHRAYATFVRRSCEYFPEPLRFSNFDMIMLISTTRCQTPHKSPWYSLVVPDTLLKSSSLADYRPLPGFHI